MDCGMKEYDVMCSPRGEFRGSVTVTIFIYFDMPSILPFNLAGSCWVSLDFPEWRQLRTRSSLAFQALVRATVYGLVERLIGYPNLSL